MTASRDSHPLHRDHLWLLAYSPTIWAVHFLSCYATAAVWCARFAGPGEGLGPVHAAIVVLTVLALGGIAATGWRGWRMHQFGMATVPHDFDTPEDRHRFLGFATFLLSSLGAVATIYVAVVALFFGSCR